MSALIVCSSYNFLNCHPHIDTSEQKFLRGLSHHPMKERGNTKKGIIEKHAKLQYWKD